MRHVLILFAAAVHSSLVSLFLSSPEISMTQAAYQTALYRAAPEARTCTAYKSHGPLSLNPSWRMNRD